ncbi:MAG: hypothetical protein KGL39_25235 [Patescibacteria group bacterium]|nr:hypothetical protein [Patescibacteria group bacterium]
MDSLKVTDDAAAQVAKAPNRVTLANIEAAIAEEWTMTGAHAATMSPDPQPGDCHPSLSVLTLHLVVMRNGFTVVGKSAPADAANFNAELGAKLAREDAIRQIWPLMGFALRDRLQTA